MDSWTKARVFALFWLIQAFGFAIEATEATQVTQPDSCARSIKTLTAKMDKLQADVKAIARGLGLLNPSGTVFSPLCFQVSLLSELIYE